MKALALQTWAGLRLYPVEVLGNTSKRTRIRMLATEVRMPNRRIVREGDELLVPAYAVREVSPDDQRLDHWQPGRAYGFGAKQ